jgi:large subunit ribosomal protein L21
MYAIIVTGGKQYRVMKDEVLRVEKIDAETGANVEINEVLMVGNGDSVTVGTPTVEGAKVTATVKSHGRLDKIRIVKFRRRKHHRKQMGHRQHFTEIQITGITA